MRILVDIGHPAHVHFFRHAIKIWEDHGHQVSITARGKTYVTELLDYYGFEYTVASTEKRGKLLPLLATFMGHTWCMVNVARNFDPDLIVSVSSPMAAWASAICRVPHITFDDTEHAGLEHALYLPFTRRVYTPTSFTKDLGPKQVRYEGFQELAYLHPNYFKPDPSVLQEFSIELGEPFFVLRMVSWQASHDLGRKGMSTTDSADLISILQQRGKVIFSSESERKTILEETKRTIHPAKMHDLLYYATMYIGEGGTMATEAALLGTPSIFISPLQAGNWTELESEFGLLFSFKDLSLAKEKILELLTSKSQKEDFREKRYRLLENKIDVLQYVVNEIEQFKSL